MRTELSGRAKKWLFAALGTVLLVTTAAIAAQAAVQGDDGAAIDITHYKIQAEMLPDSHALKAKATVSLKMLKQTQSVVLEMNGSLTISDVKGPDGKTALQFIQDRVNELNVKINLGQLYQAGSDLTLTFDYEGPLATPEGGPIPDTRLAYVGPEGSYLFYAARWFPFHGYASDRATSEIGLTVPATWTVAGQSDSAVTPAAGRDGRKTFTFMATQPCLPGSFAAGQFINRSITSGGLSIDMYVLPGSEQRLEQFGSEMAQILQFYSSRFGPYWFGKRFVLAEVDDETLGSYNGAGITFLAHKTLASDRAVPVNDLARDLAFQWWGQAIGLKKFDDAWVSQGLAQYSSVLYRESQQSKPEFLGTLSEVLELALAFEQEAPIARAPAQLNDQSPAYRSVVLYKGAYVYHMLRTTIGEEKFSRLLQNYYSSFKGKNGSIDDFEAQAEKAFGSSLRGFFGLWVDSTGTPEFRTDYSIIRTKEGKFKVRGTVRQNMDSFRGPVTIAMESEGGRESRTMIDLKGTAAEFEISSEGLPLDVTVDPDNRYLRISDSIRASVIVRRGIQHLEREEYAEAEEQFRAAIKFESRSSWAWYNLGLLFMEQRNWTKAVDAFTQALNGDLDPSWLEVWSYIYRGNAYDANGNRDRAVAEYNKARENGNDYNGAQRAVEKYLAEPYKRERTAGGHSS